MFLNRRLIGYIDKVKYYPAVIELELFNRVQSIIGSSNKSQKTTQHQRSIFNGITECALCGSGIIVHSTGKGIPINFKVPYEIDGQLNYAYL